MTDKVPALTNPSGSELRVEMDLTDEGFKSRDVVSSSCRVNGVSQESVLG